SAPACWRPPTAACCTWTRSTCCPTTWSTSSWTWPDPGSTGSSGTACPTRTPRGSSSRAGRTPEGGELRPQLLARFGLSVPIKAPIEPRARAEVVRRRLTHDAGGRVDGGEGDIVLRARLAPAIPADLPDTVVDFACRLAVSVGAEGLRADLVLCRAAAAFAGWEGRSVATSSDVERVAGIPRGPRRRRRPFDPPTLNPDELQAAAA